MEEKLIRDALGSPVPQHFNEELGMFTVNTLDGSTVTNGDIDFSRTKLLRDQLGSVIPQVWDSVNHKWVVMTTQHIGGGGGNTGTVLLAQGEYDALTDTEKNNGSFYIIKE
ncbi:hypothetical protein [Lysinibacillus odysseyi]|uniref:Uncharacterized protein n=1 Tax=Lysinibacillus odysseyi 34hs-1 = NBRC 100172 TaxID=1220589 RepID=A0A0A3IY74_9BACI|nr:hypothetical protein [Lysinibacillus odysseyi]KGR88395.1 hypothetical protein CD32_01665 [Lysinibacillus odysseyi 34hs-1 = NBRC 100172]